MTRKAVKLYKLIEQNKKCLNLTVSSSKTKLGFFVEKLKFTASDNHPTSSPLSLSWFSKKASFQFFWALYIIRISTFTRIFKRDIHQFSGKLLQIHIIQVKTINAMWSKSNVVHPKLRNKRRATIGPIGPWNPG